jgi:hypothetical protein
MQFCDTCDTLKSLLQLSKVSFPSILELGVLISTDLPMVHPPNARGGAGSGSFALSDFRFLPDKNDAGFSQRQTIIFCSGLRAPGIMPCSIEGSPKSR